MGEVASTSTVPRRSAQGKAQGRRSRSLDGPDPFTNFVETFLSTKPFSLPGETPSLEEEYKGMKKSVVAIMGVAALWASSSAFAATKGQTDLQLLQPARIAGQELKAGQYRLSWEGEGQDVAVTVGKGKSRIETRATLVERTNGERGVVLKRNGDGALQVTEIRLDKNRSLVLAES